MGNNIEGVVEGVEGDKCNKNLSKNKSRKKNRKCQDDFILEYNRLNNNIVNDVALLDQRRTVFVSLSGLYSSWKKCPSVTLYTALFILPLKKKWIYQPRKYMRQLTEKFNFIHTKKLLNAEMKFFIKLLKWKNESQHLVFWMLDDYDDADDDAYDGREKTDGQNQIDPFWRYLSEKLTNLYDPITNEKYKALTFDASWWQNTYDKATNHQTKYDTNIESIFDEFTFKSSTNQSIQEIVYQSNPSSLNPITAYNKYNDNDWINVKFDEGDDGDDQNDDEDSGWVLSYDYDD